MPELPEVEVIRRGLEKEVSGARILSARVAATPNAMRVIRPHTGRQEFEDPLRGATITAIERRGKFLVLHLGEELGLVAHLGMSGQLLVSHAGVPLEKHAHVVIDLEQGGQLRFVDPRTFGHLFVAPMGERGEIEALRGLGPDALGGHLTPARLSALLGAHTMKLKGLLMDQRLVAGIGNIYSDEIAFQARLHPFRPTDEVSAPEARRLALAIPEVLEDAIAHRGTSSDDQQYRDVYGEVGEHRFFLEVYQRAGQPCRRCGTPIARSRWTNRYAHFCPRCQS